jgi:hypothetical protein
MPPRRPILDRLPGVTRREPLPSLYDRYPKAGTALRRPHGLQVVALEQIVGTMRHPSQNTDDFLPLPYLRGKNWSSRWARIEKGFKELAIMPAIELVQIGDEYYVADGHNRVAAALETGAVAIDADVTELVLPGTHALAEDPSHRDAPSVLTGTDELRQAAAGRQSRTAEHRPSVDELRREQLTAGSEFPHFADVAPDEPAREQGDAEQPRDAT